MTDTTLHTLFDAAANGDAEARQQIFATVYAELRRLAKRELARRGSALTLSPTTLLHEVYLDLQERTGVAFPDRARFMTYASKAMRGLIVDHARERLAQKRGGGLHITSLGEDDLVPAQDEDLTVVAVDEALKELAAHDGDLAQIVELKFFCGYTGDEIAKLRGISQRTVERQWEKARLLLYQAIRDRH